MMPDRSFESLVPRVQASVPGCPYATIVQYIRDTAIRTCERTLYWRYQPPLFNLLPGISEYAYNRPANTDVHAVFEVLVNDRPLKRLTLEKAIETFPQWADLFSGVDPSEVWSSTPPTGLFGMSVYDGAEFNDGGTNELPVDALAKSSTPQIITQLSPDKYIILPLPDDKCIYQCRMFLALKPKHNASGMDSAIFDELEEVIMHGALQHLLVLPDQTWSDRELAAYHAKQYVSQIAERRARANLGNVRGTMRVRMQPFGA
jgi:hypothetical protein